MSLLKSYLNSTRARKALSTKPGEEGFSLIELVVVVAVLAALSAIAIPQFVSIAEKSKAIAASNTVATIAKECAVKLAEGITNPQFEEPSLQGYAKVKSISTVQNAAEGTACNTTGTIYAIAVDDKLHPDFTYNVETGAKTCNFTGTAALGEKRGCKSSKW